METDDIAEPPAVRPRMDEPHDAGQLPENGPPRAGSDRRLEIVPRAVGGFDRLPPNWLQLPSPMPIQEMVYVDVHLDGYSPFWRSIYRSMARRLYMTSADFGIVPITEADFLRVCRYLLRARIDEVFARGSGSRPRTRAPLVGDIQVPRSVAEPINNVGMYVSHVGTVIVLPRNAPVSEDAAAAMRETSIDAITLSHFNLFVRQLQETVPMNTDSISRVVDGTGYWLMSVHALDGTPATGSTHTVVARSRFHNFTPADAMLASLVQRGFDGNYSGWMAPAFQFDAVRDVPAIRAEYAIFA